MRSFSVWKKTETEKLLMSGGKHNIILINSFKYPVHTNNQQPNVSSVKDFQIITIIIKRKRSAALSITNIYQVCAANPNGWKSPFFGTFIFFSSIKKMIFLFEKKEKNIDKLLFLKTNYRNMLNVEQTYRTNERKPYILCVTYITQNRPNDANSQPMIVHLMRREKERNKNMKCKTNFEREHQFKCLGK